MVAETTAYFQEAWTELLVPKLQSKATDLPTERGKESKSPTCL